MYAIVGVAGKQFKVSKGQFVYTPKLEKATGESVTLEQVLLLDKDGEVLVGAPIVSQAKVAAKVVKHVKADKVIVFKKKRGTNYQRKQGHRQEYTQLAITDIIIK